MSKKILINATHPEENRVAIVENGVLTELDIEVAGREPTKGNIYKAVVVRVETGLQAAFVDYGAERLGFLQIDEINYSTVKPDYNTDDNRRPRINDLLHRGQEVLVQITKEERGTKGAALTTYLSLAGRYMVLMPGSQTRGVSRKAESDSQRKELKKAMSSIDLAEGIGYIVRTAALDQSREELERDYRYLIRLFESIKELEQKVKAPALIYKESNLMIRSIRDYFTTDMDEVLIDDPLVFKEAKDFFQMVMPDHVHLVKLHQERRPIFSRYQIEDQIETLSRNKVILPSGGSIVIDPTEALVAIDVNSGKMASEQNVEATATKTNLEAAEEVGRQLRLRDLGGLIVIDFIDMRERKHMRQVENQLKKSLENDKARVSVGRISQFGLLEMSRQRIKAALTEGSYLTCPHCNGSGHLKSPETQAVALLRKIHASAAKGQVSRVDAQMPMDVTSYLLNNKREELVDMERRYQLQIHIHGNRDFTADQIEIEIQKKEKEKSSQPEYIAAGVVSQGSDELVKKEQPKKKEDPKLAEPKLETIQKEPSEQETTQQDGVESAPTEAASSEAEPAKKRRRRRRRKPAAAAAEGLLSELSTDTGKNWTESTNDSLDMPLASPVLTPPGEFQTSPHVFTEEPSAAQAVEAAKPKRRRSRRKPKTAASSSAQDTVATEVNKEQLDSAPKPAAEPMQKQTEATIATIEPKPKPRRPRRPAKKPGAVTAEATASTDRPAPQPVQQQAEKPMAANAAGAPPKSSSTSRARAQSKAARSKADQAPELRDKAEQAKEDEKRPAKKAPARRTGGKAAAKEPAPESLNDVATAKQDKTVTISAAATPKPKSRRPVKKKPTTVVPASQD